MRHPPARVFEGNGIDDQVGLDAESGRVFACRNNPSRVDTTVVPSCTTSDRISAQEAKLKGRRNASTKHLIIFAPVRPILSRLERWNLYTGDYKGGSAWASFKVAVRRVEAVGYVRRF